MKNSVIGLTLFLALTLSARSQYAKPLNSFAAVLQLGSENLTKEENKAAFDRVIFHQDVHGTRWRISEYGNIWTKISEDVSNDNADANVSVEDGIVKWTSNSTSLRRAEFYSLNGRLLGSLDGQTQELSLQSFGNAVAVSVVSMGEHVHRHLIFVAP